LLIRTRREMIPTKFALNLSPILSETLHQIQQVVDLKETFEPAKSNRSFIIGMSDYMQVVFLPTLYSTIKKQAPNIQLQIKPIKQYEDMATFDSNIADISLGVFVGRIPNHLHQTILYEEQISCTARKDHPLFQHKHFTIAHYLQAEHVDIIYTDKTSRRYVDRAFKEIRSRRKVTLSVPNIVAALKTIAKSDLILTVGERIPKPLAKAFGLAIKPVPLKIRPVPLRQVWHRQHDNDLAHQWLRKLIAEVATTI